jgi:hypothetical protein
MNPGDRVINIRDGQWIGCKGRVMKIDGRGNVILHYETTPPSWPTGTYKTPMSSLELDETPREKNKRLLSKIEKDL